LSFRHRFGHRLRRHASDGFSAVADVGELYELPRYPSLPIAAVARLMVVITGSYRRVERAAIVVGLFELAFFFIAWAARPAVADLPGPPVAVM
jgi:hypothetical protein